MRTIFDHSSREYARGDVTTNGIEGAFSLLKRGIYGTWHNLSVHKLGLFEDFPFWNLP